MTERLSSVTFCCQGLVFQCSRGPLKLFWTSPQPLSPHPFSGHHSVWASFSTPISPLWVLCLLRSSGYVGIRMSSFSVLGINILANVSFEMMSSKSVPLVSFSVTFLKPSDLNFKEAHFSLSWISTLVLFIKPSANGVVWGQEWGHSHSTQRYTYVQTGSTKRTQ